MKPLALTDSQMDQVHRCGEPLNPQDRGPYLEKVAELWNGHEIGDGLVGRVRKRPRSSSSGRQPRSIREF
jgi:hypothetical protein